MVELKEGSWDARIEGKIYEKPGLPWPSNDVFVSVVPSNSGIETAKCEMWARNIKKLEQQTL